MLSVEYLSYNHGNDMISIGRLDYRKMEFLVFLSDHPMQDEMFTKTFPRAYDRERAYAALNPDVLRQLLFRLKERKRQATHEVDSFFSELKETGELGDGSAPFPESSGDWD